MPHRQQRQGQQQSHWRRLLCLFLLHLPFAHAGSSWDVQLARFFFGRPAAAAALDTADADDCQCVSPFDDELCRNGAVSVCQSFVCFESDAICDNQSLEEFLFLQGCNLFMSVVQRFNCDNGVSDRPNAVQCFTDSLFDPDTATAVDTVRGIRQTIPARGNCEAGSCCTADNLCPQERILHFIFLGYGILVDDNDDDSCTESTDFYGPDADCTLVTDGKSNDAVVCRDANVLVQPDTDDDDDRVQFCEVSLTATNDIIDLLRFVRQYVNVGDRRRIRFASPDGSNDMEFTAIRGLVDIALGPEDAGNGNGIVDIAFAELESKGCFTRENAGVFLTGHSLGGFLANVLALQIAAQYPDVTLRITTAGEPAGLVVPLQGPAAELDVWNTKMRYISGKVLPVSNAVAGIGFRQYGLYQVYDFVPQIIPSGLYMEGEGSTVRFLCETLQPDGRLSYFMAADGCAAGRDDVENDIALFPMEGILEEPSLAGFLIRMFLSIFFPDIDSELRRSISVWLSVASTDLREDFAQVLDMHLMRRYMKVMEFITRSGEQCDATIFTEQNPLRETCL